MQRVALTSGVPVINGVRNESGVLPTMDGIAVTEIALDLIDNNPYQTRGIFPEDELKELADSISGTSAVIVTLSFGLPTSSFASIVTTSPTETSTVSLSYFLKPGTSMVR